MNLQILNSPSKEKDDHMLSNNNLKSIILAAATIGFVSGCGTFGNKNKDEGGGSTESWVLTGNWKNDCKQRSWLTSSVYDQQTRNFGLPNTFERNVTIYSDSGCATAEATVHEKGTYQDLGASSDVSGAHDINYTVTDASLTPRSDNAVKLLNDVSYCGMKNWEKNKEMNILDHDCIGANHPKGEVQFDIYRIDNNGGRLRTGNPSFFLDRGDAHSRPKSLDDAHSFNRP